MDWLHDTSSVEEFLRLRGGSVSLRTNDSLNQILKVTQNLIRFSIKFALNT